MEIDAPQLNRLGEYSHKELKQFVQAFCDGVLPMRVSASYLRAQIAWMLQATTQGLSQNTYQLQMIKKLERAGKSFSTGLRPGTRLVREWHGNTHHVDVLVNGYEYQGKNYRSLSRIAGDITGAKWSGPRFFGLKGCSLE